MRRINNLSREQIVLVLLLVVIIIGVSFLLIREQVTKAVVVSTVNKKNDFNNESNGQNGILSTNDIVEGEGVEKEDQRIIIHIAGEVKQSGVYELPGDARVIDAVMAAGGETSYADLDSMNLASPVFDGEKIYVPSIIETKLSDKSYVSGNKLSSTGVSSNKININKASSKELEELPGIGPSKASSIIDYRDEIGRFSDLEQLTAVSGIGEKTLQKIKNKISVR
ncbi:helix-hairpin-helix domain-containing protein [Halocella sp. SP3-1]|uniref:helix-hairpin-helix domain-containing protein n=1 Tax=Halocella sp. SP3-1 TaxID=2382161 RepID=UPI000F7598F3|nr:helix-hairpin-helix domain-containing protein [Halocella sp. SP3-1]AZO94985.1 hypothetical protein D7D81_10515 [Halocella sp. SP3-1]MTI61257.1 hypothetical protein [Bacillota bacterium]